MLMQNVGATKRSINGTFGNGLFRTIGGLKMACCAIF